MDRLSRGLALLQNQLKVSMRNLVHFRVYSLLNLATLAIAFAAVILIGIYLHFETSFDAFHSGAPQIYRVSYDYSDQQGFAVNWARIPVDYVNELPKEFPEIERLVRFQNQEQKYLRIGRETFKPRHAYVTDADIFSVFDYPMIVGDPATALAQPNSIVLTETLAQKYFGSTSALGQIVYMVGDWSPDEVAYHITGVMADPPANTHMPIEMLISFASQEARTGWAYVYIKTQQLINPDVLESRFKSFVARHASPENADHVQLKLQPLTDIHLHSDLAREIVPNGSAQNISAFFIVAILILIIALINYTNLSSTLVMTRTKEMGVRRILGAGSSQLTGALILTSMVTNIVAAFIGALFVYLVYPYFRDLTGVEFLMSAPLAVSSLIALALVCGLLTGWYPASMIQASRLRNKISDKLTFSLANDRRMQIRSILLTVQFSTSILLVASAFLAARQFRFIHEKQLGLQKEQVLTIPGLPDLVTQHYSVFRERLVGVPGVKEVAACMEVPSREIRDVGKVLIYGKTENRDQVPRLDIQIMDQNLPDLMQFEWLAGNSDQWRDIRVEDISMEDDELSVSEYLHRQPRGYVINESALSTLGWDSPDAAIGQKINWSNGAFELAYGPIMGVVADFHQETLRNKIDPIVMTYEPIWLRTFLIRLEAEKVPEALAAIDETWSQMFPSYALDYHFLDELYEKLYKKESLQLKLLYLFSGLTVFIAFVGLLSLIAFTLRIRSRVIAIRQILGADFWSLWRTLSRDYVLLFLIGAIMAIPLSLYWASEWLNNYAYHIDITALPYMYTLAGLGFFLFAIIMLQIIIKSQTSPSEILRDD